MSNSSVHDPRIALPEISHRSPLAALGRFLKGAAFWTAVALPFLHLPLLATGLESSGTFTAFLLLVALNVFALVFGHPYGSP